MPLERTSLPLVDRLRVEQPRGIHERQLWTAFAFLDLAIEARFPTGVAGRTCLIDADPDRVLIAVDAHLDDALGLTRALAFSPQRIA